MRSMAAGRPGPCTVLSAIRGDTESVAGGSDPAPAGITLGPAVTFAYLMARAMTAG